MMRVLTASDPFHRLADRYGRKTSLYLAWMWLVIVSYAPGGDGVGAESANELTSLGLRAAQRSQDSVCMGKLKLLPAYDNDVIVCTRAELFIGRREALQWRRYWRPSVSIAHVWKSFPALVSDLAGSYARCTSWRSARTGSEAAWSPSKQSGMFPVAFGRHHSLPLLIPSKGVTSAVLLSL